jgi:hypothetical protein
MRIPPAAVLNFGSGSAGVGPRYGAHDSFVSQRFDGSMELVPAFVDVVRYTLEK